MRRILVAMTAGSLLLLVACGDPDSTSSAGPGDQVAIDVGSVVAVDLPSEFPADLPLPEDAVPVHVAQDVESGPTVWFASGQSQDDLKLFFESTLEPDGSAWKLTWHEDVQESAGFYSLFAIASELWTASIYVGQGGPGANGYGDPYSFRIDLTPI